MHRRRGARRDAACSTHTAHALQADASAVLDAAQLAAATAAALEESTYEVDLVCYDSPSDGRELRVVGSCGALGFWAIESGVVLRPARSDGACSARVRLPAEETAELKLVEVDVDGNNPVWQVRTRMHGVRDWNAENAAHGADAAHGSPQHGGAQSCEACIALHAQRRV
jgi:hypothetical protein